MPLLSQYVQELVETLLIGEAFLLPSHRWHGRKTGVALCEMSQQACLVNCQALDFAFLVGMPARTDEHIWALFMPLGVKPACSQAPQTSSDAERMLPYL